MAKAQVLARPSGQFPAPLAALDAIAKGCNLPLEEGLKVETEHFVPLVGSPISRNLIAIFFMSQRLQKDPGVADAVVQPRPVNRVGVVGAGIMGAGIAGAHVRRGIPVMMLDMRAGRPGKGRRRHHQGHARAAIDIGRADARRHGRRPGSAQHLAHAWRHWPTATSSSRRLSRTRTSRPSSSASCKRSFGPDAILASNTSTISITRMAEAVAHPENFAGMHFFNPVDRMQLVEVIRGEKTSDQPPWSRWSPWPSSIGKTPIVVRDCPGFLVNRILFPYINESLVLLEEGAPPRAIDKAATAFGMPMGPITLNDVVGLDTSLYAGRVVNTAFADRAVKTRDPGELVAAGRLGQKSGAGFYSYAKGSRGTDDPAFEAILAKCRTGKREIGMEEITRSAVPADADGGEPGADGRHRARAGRRGHGPDPGHRLPSLPRRPAALGRQPGIEGSAGEAREIRLAGTSLPADGADPPSGGSGAGVLSRVRAVIAESARLGLA